VRHKERVDAGDVRVDLLSGLLRQRGICCLGGAPEADRAKKAILRQRRGTEDLGQTAVTNASLELHLPQPILRVRVAQTVERVEFRRGENVRNGIGVPHDLNRRQQADDCH